MLNSVNETQLEELTLLQKHPVEAKRMREWLDEKIAAGKKKPFAEVATLTPVLALLLSERNPLNRPLSKRNLVDLKRDLATNNFVFNGQGIIVTDTGIVGDGQHRIWGVIETGIAIETVMVFGVPEENRTTIDTGKSKTVSNLLYMKGKAYTGVLGSVANYVLQWKKSGVISYTQNPTKREVLHAADTYKGLDKSIEATQAATKTPIKSHAVLAACHWMFWKRTDRETADDFMLRLIEGSNLRQKDPILLCRNRLMAMDRGVHAGTRVELVVRAWNHWRRAEKIDRIRVTGELPELES